MSVNNTRFNERFRKAVLEGLEITGAEYTDELALGSIKAWDSLGHLKLMFAVEGAFDTKFDTEQIPTFTTLSAIWEALGSARG